MSKTATSAQPRIKLLNTPRLIRKSEIGGNLKKAWELWMADLSTDPDNAAECWGLILFKPKRERLYWRNSFAAELYAQHGLFPAQTWPGDGVDKMQGADESARLWEVYQRKFSDCREASNERVSLTIGKKVITMATVMTAVHGTITGGIILTHFELDSVMPLEQP